MGEPMEDAELAGAVPRLLRAARAMGHPPEPAEDLVHDVLVEFLRGRAAFRGGCALYTWLYGILLRRHVDALRKRKTMKNAPPPAASEEEAAPIVVEERSRGVQEAIDELPDPYPEVLRLRFFADFPYEEIAKLLSLPVGTVKSQVYYGLQKLRPILERRFGLSPEEVL